MSERAHVKTHKDLEVWQRSIGLVERVYRITHVFPKEEMYGLSSQIRRSVVSIPSNIAEGAARQGGKEFINFLHIALGSLAELETQIIIASRLSYCHDSDLHAEIDIVRKMILGLIKHLKARQ